MTSLGPLLLATLILQQSPGNPTTPPTPVYREGQGVTSPVLVREAKPNYTTAALRARIQGAVLLECVVMPDGSIGDVRVVRSLDPLFGLDKEAVKTVKQWRFTPGMKDGAPVPVLVMVEMSFTLKDNPDSVAPGARPAVFQWPDAFFTSPPSNTTFVGGTLHSPSLDVTFSYPSTWSNAESNGGTTLYTEDANGIRAVTISSPQPASFSLTEALTQSALDSSTLATQSGAAFTTNLRVVKSGQVLRAGGGPWIWFEMTAPSIAAWNAPTAVADHLRSGYGALHVWTFATTAAGQIVNVFCTVVHRAGLSDGDQRQQIRLAAHECGAILTGISIPVR